MEVLVATGATTACRLASTSACGSSAAPLRVGRVGATASASATLAAAFGGGLGSGVGL